jgi:hypothetical protein
VYRITPVGLPAQPGSGAYRLLGGLPWKARLNWSPNGSDANISMGDLMGREYWWVKLRVLAENRLGVAVTMYVDLPPANWYFIGTAS